MSWGPARRPKIRYGSVSSPIRDEGSDGDIRIEETNLGAKLFGKIGGKWYGAPVTATEGNPITRIGIKLSDHLAISADKLEFMKNSKSMLAITSDGDINMTGKIILTTENANVCLGTSNSNNAANNVAIWVGAGKSLQYNGSNGSHGNILIGLYAGENLVGSPLVAARGSSNIFIGNYAGNDSTQSNYNVAIGTNAMQGSALSSQNVCIGYEAGGHDDFESLHNAFIGYQAGDAVTTGQYNIAIGSLADCAATANNQIAIGYNATVADANTIVMGNASITAILPADDGGVNLGSDAKSYDAVWAADGAFNGSDIRIKEDINPLSLGLEFINKLNPVSYKKKDKEEVYEGERLAQRAITYKRKHSGLIAQEVKEVMDDMDIASNDFAGYVDANVNGGVDRLFLRYTEFIAPLIKAVQELSAKIDTMQTEINNLKAE